MLNRVYNRFIFIAIATVVVIVISKVIWGEDESEICCEDDDVPSPCDDDDPDSPSSTQTAIHSWAFK